MKRDGNKRGRESNSLSGIVKARKHHLMNVNLNKSSDVSSLSLVAGARKVGEKTIYLINVVEGTIKSR